jgi:predicted MFS family arabinose efflux permease
MTTQMDSVPDLGEGARRALVVGVLAASMGVAIMPVISVGVLAPLLIEDLSISRVAIGLLVSLASAVSALLSPWVGRVVDRIGDRTALLLVLGTGTLSLAVMASASSYEVLVVALAIAGICHSGSNPATNRLITRRVAPGGRGWVTGVKQSGEAVAIVLGGSVLPATALLLGWRGSVIALIAVASVALIAASLSIDGSRPPVAEKDDPVDRLRPSIYWLGAYSFAMGAAGGSLTAYLPLYAHEAGELSIEAAGGVMVVAGTVAIAGRILWSRWTETRLGVPVALITLAGLAVIAAVILVAAPSLGSPAFWLGAALWGASGLSFGAVGMLAAMAESEDSNTGGASGWMVFGFGAGLTLTPPVFGWLVDETQGYSFSMALVTGFFALSGVIIILGRSRFRASG